MSLMSYLTANFETRIEVMYQTLDILSRTDLESQKGKIGLFKYLENPVEQNICIGLILSMYGNMESCIMQIVESIELKTKVRFKDFGKGKRYGTLYKMKLYIETYSNIRFNEFWFKEAKLISKIRNDIIHNGSFLRDGEEQLREQLDKYALLEEILDSGVINISENLECLYNVMEVIDNVLNGLIKNEINIEVKK